MKIDNFHPNQKKSHYRKNRLKKKPKPQNASCENGKSVL